MREDERVHGDVSFEICVTSRILEPNRELTLPFEFAIFAG